MDLPVLVFGDCEEDLMTPLRTNRNYHLSTFCELIQKWLWDFRSSCTNMYCIVRSSFRNPLPPIALHYHHSALDQQIRVILLDIRDGLLDQARDVLDPVGLATVHHLRHGYGEVAAAGADVERAFAIDELVSEKLLKKVILVGAVFIPGHERACVALISLLRNQYLMDYWK